ncbi:MAG: RNA 2',3'-cyclic phosphodiesterase [Phycisphaerae bacterium]|nr:RNA 2',3'-cyclic phosphodiesterase [Phycisphaerae bacterium]
MFHRTFIALDGNEAVRRRLIAMRSALQSAVGRGDRVNWVSPENFHVTLKFLGEVADVQLAEVCRVVQAVAAGAKPFDFAVGRLQLIPPAGRSLRMVWADVAGPDGRMAELFERIEQALEPLGFPREHRPFSPHITLARVKYIRDAEALRVAAGKTPDDNETLYAEHVTVYTSRLLKGGPVYTPAVRAQLRGDQLHS